MRISNLPEEYTSAIQHMHRNNKTYVRSAAVTTDGFDVKVRLPQESVLSPFFLAVVLDRLTDDVRREASQIMIFVDNNMLCSEARQDVKKQLGRWCTTLGYGNKGKPDKNWVYDRRDLGGVVIQ